MLNLSPKITAAGLALVRDAAATPGKSVAITAVAIGSQSYSPVGTESALKLEFARFPVSGGPLPNGTQVQLAFTITNTDPQNRSTSSQWVGEVGFYAGDTLFAILSKPEPAFFYKSQDIDIPIAYSLDVSALPAGSVTVNASSDAGALAALISGHELKANAHPDIVAALTLETAKVAVVRQAAEAARDAALIQAGVYATEALGRAAVGDGQAFKVQGSGDVAAYEYRRVSSASSTLIAAYPAAAAVQKPSWAGKINGWPDTFFRRVKVGDAFPDGRTRWWDNGAPSSLTSWELVPNPVFQGAALRKTGNANLSGPRIYLSDLQAAPGDTVTVYALIRQVAAPIGMGFYIRPYSAANAGLAAQINGTNDAGTLGLTTSDAPQLIKAECVVPASTSYIGVYPTANTADGKFDVLALWAVRGNAASGPAWPALADGTVAAMESRVDEVANDVAGVEAITNSAFVTTGTVSAAATTITVEGSGFSTNARDLPFCGWGERYSPAGVSFNAVRCKLVSRAAALPSSRWRTLHVLVRTGANSHNGGTLVAKGSITVREDYDSLTDLTILLKDPVSGAVTTLTDASFIGGEYFVAVYARNSAGAYAACGEPRGTLANSLGQSYYLTSSSGAAESSVWFAAAGGSNIRLAFQHLLLTSPGEGVAATLLAQAAPPAALVVPDVVVPPYIYGVQARECNVYFDNLYLSDACDYLHDVTSASSTGQQQNERWTWTPAGAMAAGTLSLAVYDKKTATLLTTKNMEQRAAASSAGTGMTKKVIVIGDSLINAGVITQTLLDNAGGDAMAVSLLGTQGTAPNKHEGRGGWTIANYTTAGPTYYDFTVSGIVTPPALNATEYSHNGAVYRVQTVTLVGGAGTLRCSVTSGGAPLASGTLTKSNGSAGDATIAFTASAVAPGNPFWIGGALNFPQYLADSGAATPDWVFIALGINDGFSYTSDAAVSAAADSAFISLDALIASIKAAGASVKVALMIPTPPSSDQDSHGANYGVGQARWRSKRNVLIWGRQLIAKYAGQEASRVYLVPSNTALDTVNNMQRAAAAPVNSRSTVTVMRQNNGVHPATSGYQQIGDAMWAFLKYYAGA